ncbi:MAG: hypothetical protein AAFX90_10230 [Pseudomonadota bacterium]
MLSDFGFFAAVFAALILISLEPVTGEYATPAGVTTPFLPIAGVAP